MGVHIGLQETEQLVQETEGWPVGIRLAAVALRDEPDPSGTLTNGFCGEDRDVAHYVHEEWLSGLSADDVDFLMQVSSSSGSQARSAIMCWAAGVLTARCAVSSPAGS